MKLLVEESEYFTLSDPILVVATTRRLILKYQTETQRLTAVTVGEVLACAHPISLAE